MTVAWKWCQKKRKKKGTLNSMYIWTHACTHSRLMKLYIRILNTKNLQIPSFWKNDKEHQALKETVEF